MIIYNGNMSLEELAGGGTDDLGRPIQPTSEWGKPIPCRLQVNSDNRKGRYENGKFRQASFILLVDPMEINFKRVRLSWMGEEQGEYDVLSYKWLEAVGAMQIMVAN